MRACSAPGENPPNTTLCVAPSRAQASIANTASGIIGSWIATRSPACTPSSVSALAALHTSLLQLGVGDGAGVARLALPVERDLVAVPVLDVPVDAVVGDVQLAADEPLGERRLPVEHLVPLLVPVQPVGLLGPERLAVGVGAGVPVLRGVGLGGELLARREAAALGGEVAQRRFDSAICGALLVRGYVLGNAGSTARQRACPAAA